jgi:hypothetical protein
MMEVASSSITLIRHDQELTADMQKHISCIWKWTHSKSIAVGVSVELWPSLHDAQDDLKVVPQRYMYELVLLDSVLLK